MRTGLAAAGVVPGRLGVSLEPVDGDRRDVQSVSGGVSGDALDPCFGRLAVGAVVGGKVVEEVRPPLRRLGPLVGGEPADRERDRARQLDLRLPAEAGVEACQRLGGLGLQQSASVATGTLVLLRRADAGLVAAVRACPVLAWRRVAPRTSGGRTCPLVAEPLDAIDELLVGRFAQLSSPQASSASSSNCITT